jgi:hypothetical protein
MKKDRYTEEQIIGIFSIAGKSTWSSKLIVKYS